MRVFFLGIFFFFFYTNSQAQQQVRIEYTAVKEYGLFGQKERKQKVSVQIDSLRGTVRLKMEHEAAKQFKVAYMDHYEVEGKYCDISVHATRENVLYSFRLLVDDAFPEESESAYSVVFNGTENRLYKFLGGAVAGEGATAAP